MKFIKYKRISYIVDSNQLQKNLDDLIKEGWVIISYEENILEKTPTIERILVTMLVGKQDQNTKQIL